MRVYRVYYKDFSHTRGVLLGTLDERRGDLRGKGLLESGLRWARSAFGDRVRDKKHIFVVPVGWMNQDTHPDQPLR